MGQAFLHGNGGGTSLNFKVVGGTTQPTDPKENTIWCKTSVPISYLFIDGVTWVPTWEAGIGTVYLGYEAGVGSPGADNALLHIVKLRGNMQEFLAKLTACHQNQDGTASGWKSLDAYIYKSGNWVQFSSVFTAGINISYPAGSILTCTDGSTTLTAGNTTGSWYFTIPNAGNWTVTATSGSNSASQTVAITADGQIEQVMLIYEEYLVEDGKLKTTLNKYSSSGAYLAVIESDSGYVHLYGAADGYHAWYAETDLTKYNTMHMETTDTEGGADYSSLCVWPSSISNPMYNNASARIAMAGTGTVSLDISSLNGTYFVGVTNATGRRIKIVNWWVGQ